MSLRCHGEQRYTSIGISRSQAGLAQLGTMAEMIGIGTRLSRKGVVDGSTRKSRSLEELKWEKEDRKAGLAEMQIGYLHFMAHHREHCVLLPKIHASFIHRLHRCRLGEEAI